MNDSSQANLYAAFEDYCLAPLGQLNVTADALDKAAMAAGWSYSADGPRNLWVLKKLGLTDFVKQRGAYAPPEGPPGGSDAA